MTRKKKNTAEMEIITLAETEQVTAENQSLPGGIIDAIPFDVPTKMFEVEIEFTEKLIGTVPLDRDTYTLFIEGKAPEEVRKALVKPESEDVEESDEKGFTGFRSDENGIYLIDYMIKGFLKEAGNVLKDSAKVKNMKSKITQHVFIYPRKIYLGMKEAHGIFERPLRAETMKGPRTSIARSDYVEAGVRIRFLIEIINGPITPAHIAGLLVNYGPRIGLGQFRSGGFGRFTVTRFQDVDKGKEDEAAETA